MRHDLVHLDPVNEIHTMSNTNTANPRFKTTLNYVQTPDGCFDVDCTELVAYAIKNSDVKRIWGTRFLITSGGELTQVSSKKALENILKTVACPAKVEAFRNIDRGVTIAF